MKVKAPNINIKVSTPKSIETYPISKSEIVALVEESSNEESYSLEEAEKIHKKRIQQINGQLSNAANKD